MTGLTPTVEGGLRSWTRRDSDQDTGQVKTGMRNVLFIAYRFPPCGGGGVYRNSGFARFLPLFGYKPIVVTASANLARKGLLDRSLLRGVLSSVVIERVPDFDVVRMIVGVGRRIGGETLPRWFFWPDDAVVWSVLAVMKAQRAMKRYGADVIYASGGPFSSFLAGAALKFLSGLPLILDFRDPWTQNSIRNWPTRAHFRIDQALEKFALTAADAVIMNTPTAREHLLFQYPDLAADSVYVLPNGYDEQVFSTARPLDKSRIPFRIVHAGKFYGPGAGPGQRSASGLVDRIRQKADALLSYNPYGIQRDAHSPMFLLQALAALFEDHPELKCKFEVLLAGPPHSGISHLIRQLGLSQSVQVLGFVPHETCVSLLKSADLLLLTHFAFSGDVKNPYVGGKTYEYMASGKPILALLTDSDAKNIVRESGLGIICPPTDVEAIRGAPLQLYREHEGAGVSVNPNWDFIKQFERKGLTKQLGGIFDSVLSSAS